MSAPPHPDHPARGRRAWLWLAAAMLSAPAWAAKLRDAPGAAGSAAGAAAPAAPADAAAPAVPIVTGQWVHALSAYAPPKYPPGFRSFEYVNPDAPVRGTLKLRNPDRRSSFDKFNPYTTRGTAPAAITMFMLEPLAIQSMDEPQAVYGVLAEAMRVEPDLSAISFRLDPRARFSNGDPVTAADVVYTLQRVKSKEASPTTQIAAADLARAVALDERTVRIELSARTLDAVFAAASLNVFSHKWGTGKKFDEVVLEPPIATGPYLIDRYEMPSRLDLKLNPSYWGREVASRRGHFNFERVSYHLYNDEAVAREAFKAGDFDIFKEYRASAWVRQHQGAKWRDGRIVKRAFETSTGQGLQAIRLNVRRPLFQDIRVREALLLAWDFDRYNQYGTFKHAHSLFNNSPFAAAGEPSPAELKLLDPFRAELPPRVFGPAFVPPSNADGAPALRAHLRRARDMLAQAGWQVAADGRLRNAKGEAFEFEYLEPGSPGRMIDFQRNLAKLGIAMKERIVDFALYRRRLEQYDYDVIVIVEGDFTLPSASDLSSVYGSKSAGEPGNNNFSGVRSRAVDALIAAIGRAVTMDELIAAARALDRVVMWNFWSIPQVYVNQEQASYWNRFGIPAVQAKYFVMDSYPSSSSPPWPLWTWWLEGGADAPRR
ncbi:MAG TPA: extracellular solute-binding protein [Burkholderiaceae bacterium]|nr:extracellular solute-binding protein [Burkholderiaceae bacterium]